MFFVEGWRWLEEALDMPHPPRCVLTVPGAARSAAESGLLARAQARALEFAEVSTEQLARLTENVNPPGVAALVEWRPSTLEALLDAQMAGGPSMLIALDGVGDPGNAGTIVRTADWFDVGGILFGEGSVEPSNSKTTRATMGSLFHLPVAVTDSLGPALERLRVGDYSIVGAALDGDDLGTFAWPDRCVLVAGSEANGIRPSVAGLLDKRVRIPSYGRAESLNVAVASALLMADWRRGHPGRAG